MAKLFKISKKYEVELDVAEAHTIDQALRQYGRDKDFLGNQYIQEYISELRTRINTVRDRDMKRDRQRYNAEQKRKKTNE